MLTFRRVIVCLVFLAFILAGCGPLPAATFTPAPTLPPATATPVPVDAASPLAQYYIPPYYAPEYINIVEDSRQESGLVIYSTIAAASWDAVIESFNAHYPWIKVTTFDLGPNEVFTRHEAESGKGTRTADLVISTDQNGWFQFVFKGKSLAYHSEEDLFVPEWSKPTIGSGSISVGIYTAASDPMLIIYNKLLVGDPPGSMQDLLRIITRTPELFKNQVVTYDAELNATGFVTNWFWVNRYGPAGWETLSEIGKAEPALKTSESVMVDAVGKGDLKLGYFVPAIAVFPKLADYPNLGWNYINDGQPVLLRYMAITQNAASPNSAKLMLDFILSQEGQLALDQGGLTPYRSDVFGISSHHLDAIAQRVGDKKLLLFSLDTRLMAQPARDSFLARWLAAIQKPVTPTPIPTPTPQPSPTP